MLLTENIVYRYKEWRDSTVAADEPDLVERYRRLWSESPAEGPRAHRRLMLPTSIRLLLRHRAAAKVRC